jgi:hypothetical protein
LAVAINGAYHQEGEIVEITAGIQISTWDLQFSGDQVTMTGRGSPPPNVITLLRR